MSITDALCYSRVELIQSFHTATIHGMLDTWRRCGRLAMTPQELDFVAGLVTESTPLIHAALTSILSSWNISVSMCSVFCHQKPEVTFTSGPPASCELGDILFAFIHTPRTGNPIRNAVLFQAKKSAQQPYRIRTCEKDQLRLYRDWPDFKYTRSSFLNGQSRSVTPKTPHPGAQYLRVDDSPLNVPMSNLLGFPGTYPVGCCMPDESLFDHNHLAAELFDLFIFCTGRPFDGRDAAKKTQDWSQVVWDLLESGVRKMFQRKNSGRFHCPRSSGDTVDMLDGVGFARASSRIACSTVTEILGRERALFLYREGDDLPPDDGERNTDSVESDGGVSVVLIETSERE
jgi:hypothetical protein